MIQQHPVTAEVVFTLQSTIEFIDSLEKTVNAMRIHTRRLAQFPFDTVAGELISKCFALSRSAILLAQSGYPDEGFGLCRSLYESSIYLRYITEDPEKRDERAHKFLEFGLTSKAFWFDLLTKSDLSDAERQDIARYKAENRIPDEATRITQPWSEERRFIEKFAKVDHPTDSAASTELFRLKEKAIGYTDTSSYVHCTQPGLNSYAYEWKEAIITRKSKSGHCNTVGKTCMVIHVHLRAVIRYCLFGLGLASAEQLRDRQHPATDIMSTDEQAS